MHDVVDQADLAGPARRRAGRRSAGSPSPAAAAPATTAAPPTASPRPTFTSLTANDACSAATTRSHCWASRNPPANATPLTAAIVGFGTSMLRPNCGRKSGGATSSAVSAISLRSPPAQNAFSPAPVSTSTAAESSASNRRMPSHSPSRTALFSALRASGRSIVIQATPSSTSYVTTSLTGTSSAARDGSACRCRCAAAPRRSRCGAGRCMPRRFGFDGAPGGDRRRR